MVSSVPKPLQPTRPQRRGMLSRHLIPVTEALVAAGESYAELSVESIITAGGISRSTFYSYFQDKGDLLVAMARDVIGDLVGVGHSWWDLDAGLTPGDLRAALRVPIDTYRAHATILGAVVEAAAYDARVREQQQWLIDQVVGSLAEHLRVGQRAGFVVAELDAECTARWVIWMLERGLYQLVSPADDAEAERLLEALTGLVWRGLYVEASSVG